MTRLWAGGVQVEVHSQAAQQPVQFIWEGRRHHVDGIANQWRVDVRWWRLRVWRDYYKLYTDTGLLVVLYHDLVSDNWYLQRVYD